MIQLISPIADNNTIFGNTCSNDSRAIYFTGRERKIQKDSGYYIFLGPSFRIVIEDERIFESIKMALHHLHLYPFASGLESVPQQFLNLIRSPLQFNKDDLNSYHPLIFYLTGILSISMTTVTTELAVISPISVILKRLNELSILGDNSYNMHKQNILLKYSVFQGLDIKFLLSALYDLVKGNEGFFLLTLIILTIDSIFPRQLDSSISTIELNNNLAQVEDALDILKNLEKIEKQKEIDLLFSKLDDLNLGHCNSKSLGKDSSSTDVVTQKAPFIFDMYHSLSPKHTSCGFLRDSLYLQQTNQNSINTLDMNKEFDSLASSKLWNPIQSSVTNSYLWNSESTDKSISPKSDIFWSLDAIDKNALIIEEDKPDYISLSCKDPIVYGITDKAPYSDLVSEDAVIDDKFLQGLNCDHQERIYKNNFENNITSTNNTYSVSSDHRYIRDKYHNKNTEGSPLDSSDGNKSQSNSNEGYQKRETTKGTNPKAVNEYSTYNTSSLNQQSESNESRDNDDDNNGDDKKNHSNASKNNDNSRSDSDSDSDSDSNSESEAGAESVLDSESNSASGLYRTEDDKEEHDVVEMLSDLFPIYPRSELVARVKSTSDVENLIDVLFSEQEDQSKSSVEENDAKNYSSDVLTLKEIFPEYDFEVLRKILNRNDENIALASAVILQGDSEEITSLEDKTNKFLTDNRNNTAQLQSSWIALQTEASRLEDILNIPSQQLLSYLHKHEGKFHETLIAIINDNSVKRLSASSASSSSSRSSLASFSRHVPRGGRVQGSSSKPTNPAPSIRYGSIPPEDSYRYDENSLEAKEIKAIYVGNPEFKSINEQFFENLLVFFRGDVAKVIEIAALLVQDKAGHFTFKQKPPAMSFSSISQAGTGKRKKPVSLIEPYKQSNLNPASATAYVSLSDSSSGSIIATSSRSPTPTDEISLMKEKLKSAAKTNTLDLHNLTVPTALEATGQALRDWWKDELDQRHVDGNLTKFGSRVQFVSPLNLVTGRGIHSQGGKAKIRIAVKKYLTRNNYVFEEYSGRFEIEGKR